MSRILITGAFGQLGTSLRNILSDQSILATGRMVTVEEKMAMLNWILLNQTKYVKQLLRTSLM